jgi:hypothetical protein
MLNSIANSMEQTPSWEVAQLVQKCFAFYRTVFTWVHNWTYPEPHESNLDPSHPICNININIILSSAPLSQK